MKSKLKTAINLFFTMLKIGLFTFGGGYAMIALLENEFVSKKKWIEKEEFLDMVAIAESTPGPIAINSATYIGYKMSGFFGSLFATVAVCIPSFVIIYIISLFLDSFLAYTPVQHAFKGIQICVIYLILSAGIKMLKGIKKSAYNYLVFLLTVACIIAFSLLDIGFSSVFYILISGCLGIFLYLVGIVRSKSEKKEGRKNA